MNDREFIVAIPFCTKDANLQLNNVRWMGDMGQPKTHDAILSFDEETPDDFVYMIWVAAFHAFKSVLFFEYPAPLNKSYPNAPNHAFKYLAYYIYQEIHRPWLFLEYDEIPVKPYWLIKLQDEYNRCGKPFMGNIVDGTHMNGGGIYPPNYPEYSPAAMNCDGIAWDWEQRNDIMRHVHRANHLIDQRFNESFRTQADVERWISPSIVLYHSSKDVSLISRLRERMNKR